MNGQALLVQEALRYLAELLRRLVNGRLQSRIDGLTPWSWAAALTA